MKNNKSNNVIEFSKVSKKFKRGRKLLLKEAFLDIFKPGATEEFWPLKDINLKVLKDETLGIIGNNGSGKSTILKLIAGVMIPDKGEVEVDGKIAPLIELGAGFHPELSGRENIYLNSAILGLTRNQVDRRFDDIVNFAELEEFIDTPIKHYSSGMYMRLGFAIAVHTTPDILLIDEILAVGDIAFQEKCMNVMQEYKRGGMTIVYISHSMETVQKFCDRVVLLVNGEIDMISSPQRVVNRYNKIASGSD